MNQQPPSRAARGQPFQGEAPAAVRPPLLDSRELLRGHRTIEIHHNGELYRLQATRSGKLILTK